VAGAGFMEELMTLQEVAAYLKMSSQTIYRLAQQSRIPALKVQSRWRFRRSDIESWLAPGDNNAPRQSFGLIYLDLVLPDISGPETLRAIRQIDDSARVVVITGYQESELLQEILELGPFTVLVKPFGVNEIVETARMCV